MLLPRVWWQQFTFLFVWLRSTTLWYKPAFQVVKHSELVGQVYGIHYTSRFKLAAFGISASILAAGAFSFGAIYQRSIIWTEFNVLLSCLLSIASCCGRDGKP